VKAKFDASSIDIVKIVNKDEVKSVIGEEAASLLRNETVVWAKFVLTDDAPNGNGMRIPHEEFANLINSGIHMPFKMAYGQINEGHEGAGPFGVITHLKEEKLGEHNLLIGMAALWGKERPEDVLLFKSAMASEDEKPQVSWEILYGDYSRRDDGTIDLKDTSLSAVTVVGNPAYEGRTPVLAVAAKQWSKAYLEKLEDDAFLHIGEDGERLFPYMDVDGRVDPLRLEVVLGELATSNLQPELIEEYTERVKDLQAKLNSRASLDKPSLKKSSRETGKSNSEENKLDELTQLNNKITELETSLADTRKLLTEKDTQLTEKVSLLEQQETELASLREFKAEIEAEAAKQVKLEEIRNKFQEASINKDESYFSDNEEMLLGLNEDALDFFIQELVAFSSKEKKDNKDESKSSKVPNFNNLGDDDDTSIGSLVKALRKMDEGEAE